MDIRLGSALCLAALVLTLTPASAQQSQIEYATVAQAKSALLAVPGVQTQDQEGWLIVNEKPGVIWSFAPEGHEAHPAVGKRQLLQRNDGSFVVRTDLMCEAGKDACDRLNASYQALDEAMMKSLGKQ
jgi:hypothetical protein